MFQIIFKNNVQLNVLFFQDDGQLMIQFHLNFYKAIPFIISISLRNCCGNMLHCLKLPIYFYEESLNLVQLVFLFLMQYIRDNQKKA